MKKPKVSVLLPVYNGANYLAEAIESILSQSYQDFEIIIINDGSTDATPSILEQYASQKVRVYHQENIGLPRTLNRAIGLAEGKYIARQDHDDVSLPQRLEKQVAFLDKNPSYGLVGTWAEIWVGRVRSQRFHKHPCTTLEIKFELLFDNPFVHSSVMFTRKAIEEVGPYSTNPMRQPPEDYELWSRIARKFDVANIPEVLQIYREVPNSLCRKKANPFLDQVINLSCENLAHVLGTKVYTEIQDLAALAHGALYRVSGKPNLLRHTYLLYRAMANLSASHESVNSLALFKRAVFRWCCLCRSHVKFWYSKSVKKNSPN